ncbi:MAG: M3 family oligoendopeptidase, partial [Actinomycetota bacterium]|nr:M3 family oligoendopeptidase [Actinomycetota bacterium]
MADLMRGAAAVQDELLRAASYALLRFSVDTGDGALYQRVSEAGAQIEMKLLFVELEWAEASDRHVESLLVDDSLGFCAHHLRSMRRYKTHLLSEPEERVLTEKSVTGASAWVRLFDQLTSEIRVQAPDGQGGTEEVGLEQGLSLLASPDPGLREAAAAAVTAALEPGIGTRAYVYNTLLMDKSIEDRMRIYPSWISSRNLANEATDESVQALIDVVQSRYDIAQRWYRLKSKLLGMPLKDYDRMASVATAETSIGWTEAKDLVLDAYASFSPDLAGVAQRFFDERWIDAPLREAKRPGAFCSYTVPSHHPYVFLNWTGKARDVMTLAHELGHGCHAYLSQGQGIFHHGTPLTLAETASVFGETVTFSRMLEGTADPRVRLSLLAENIDGSVATVFRQVAMNRFENAVHADRRENGELSVERLGEHWAQSQRDMLGDSVEVTEGYKGWWSYVPHFIGTPGYVYADAYGQLLALSVYNRYEQSGAAIVPKYLQLLGSGGSMPPEELGKLVDCDL